VLLGLGISGVPFVGSDIGGYSGHASPELYARWIALGSISPFARAHVTNGVPGQEPWMFGDEVTDISRARLADRYRLLPYLYSLFDDAAHTGAPPLRPLVWEFPDDPAVRDLADEAMLGSFVLAAPVVTPGATTRQVYLPAGRWYELHSGAIFDGPTTITASLELAALPLYVRAGAILPSTGDAGELVLDVYPGAASSFSVYEDDGGSLAGPSARTLVSLAATPDGAHLSLARNGDYVPPARDIVVRVHRVDGAVIGVDGASYVYDPDDRAIVATVADAPALDLAFHYDAG
jgi:alpha-glucosidase